MVRWGEYVERNCGRQVTTPFTYTPKHTRPRPHLTATSAYNFSALRDAIRAVPSCPRYDQLRRQRFERPLVLSLPANTDSVIQKALRDTTGEQVNPGEAAISISQSDLLTLQGSNWLNDEIINGYLHLLTHNTTRRAFAFNTFFMTKLSKHGHQGVARWTRNVDLFSCDCILIPVHLGNHWTLILVEHSDTNTISYYDGLGGRQDHLVDTVADYLRTEAVVKEKSLLHYTTKYSTPAPRQQNGYDCGVFVLVYSLCIILNRHHNIANLFSQRDMPYFRRRISFELICNKLL